MDGKRPVYLSTVRDTSPLVGKGSFTRRFSFISCHQNAFHIGAVNRPPNALGHIGLASVLPAQKIATLEGVYAANRPSLGRITSLHHSITFTSLVPDLVA